MTRWKARVVVCHMAAVLLSVIVSAQAPAVESEAPTASLSGVVVANDAGASPVRRATVTLRMQEPTQNHVAVTDDDGRFTFRGLPAGRATLSVAKAGYVRFSYGAGSSVGQAVPIVLADGQAVDGIVARITKGAVIEGRLTDAFGRALPGAALTLYEQRTINGRSRFIASSAAVLTRPDDRGVFRAYGIPAGTYLIGAMPGIIGRPSYRTTTAADVGWATGPANATAPRDSIVAYGATYYPGTTDPGAATLVTVRAGEERTGVDFSMLLEPAVTVSGSIVRADGEPATMVTMFGIGEDSPIMAQAGGLSSLARLQRPVMAPDGHFTLSGLSAGRYTLVAQAPSVTPTATGGAGPVMDLWAQEVIQVAGQDLTGLRLALRPGMTLSGRVAFESGTTAPPQDLRQLRVVLRTPPGTGTSLGVPALTPDESGAFTGTAAPGTYLVGATVPGNSSQSPTWVLKSVTTAGVDVIDTGLTVEPDRDVSDLTLTFTDRVTRLTGQFVDADGRPVPQYYLLVFSTDASRWQQNSRWLRAPVRPGTDGRFTVAGLPPGDYYLAALTEVDPVEWYTSEFLEQVVPVAIRVTLAEGETKVQNISVAQ